MRKVNKNRETFEGSVLLPPFSSSMFIYFFPTFAAKDRLPSATSFFLFFLLLLLPLSNSPLACPSPIAKAVGWRRKALL